MNLNSSSEKLLLRIILVATLQNCRLFLKVNSLGEKMKMNQQLLKSKKRISSLWKRILHNKADKAANSVSGEEVSQAKKPFYVNGTLDQEDSEYDKENSSSDKASEEDLLKIYSNVMSSSPQNLPTILKKSQTDPTYRNTPSSGRHATFKEVVKVHEYVAHDSLDCEAHYTSEASLTDEDEHSSSFRRGFYVDNYPEGDEEGDTSQEETMKSFDTKKLISMGERANIFKNLSGPDDATEDSDEASDSSPRKHPAKSKSKKSPKPKSKKKKVLQELPDDLIFDFAC